MVQWPELPPVDDLGSWKPHCQTKRIKKTFARQKTDRWRMIQKMGVVLTRKSKASGVQFRDEEIGFPCVWDILENKFIISSVYAVRAIMLAPLNAHLSLAKIYLQQACAMPLHGNNFSR